MTKGKIFLLPFPFDDLSATKVRPAACLTNPIGSRRHIVLAYITSRIPTNLLETDIVLDTIHPDFAATGLRQSSTITHIPHPQLSQSVFTYFYQVIKQ